MTVVARSIFKSGLLCSLFVLFLGIGSAFAATPQIATLSNDSATQGTTYTKTPTLTSGGPVTWSKEYGPDDMTVDPNTGAVSWAIPSNLPRESFHIGVRATGSGGTSYTTWILKVGGGNYLYVGPNDTYHTLSAATGAASSGDTIVVRDGTYTGSSNMMTNIGFGSLPPSGSSSAYTTVMAEHPGAVTLDGQHTNTPIYGYGNYQSRDYLAGAGGSPNSTNVSYIAFKGFLAGNPLDNGNSNGCITFNNCHHIKVIDCGAYEADAYTTPISLNRSGYILVEGCYSWGQGRMRVVAYLCDYCIFRRNVVRADYVNVVWPFGMIDLYADQHCRVQNNIIIDSDQYQSYTYGTTAMGAFIDDSGALNGNSWAVHKDNFMWSNIALNNDMGVTSQQGFSGADPASFNNMIAWDMRAIPNSSGSAPASPILYTPASININQATFGHWRSPYYPLATDSGTGMGVWDSAWSSSYLQTVTNSIFYDLQNSGGGSTGLFDINVNANYNNLYSVGTTVAGGSPTIANTITSNPTSACLKYLPRIEAGCALQTAGASGARVGAQILTMRGKSGTMFGDAGFDTDAGAPMWPFPHEDLIKSKMQAYNMHGVSGNRGFASSTATSKDGTPQTLTKYIWEYLGNQIPAGIYPSASTATTTADTTAPTVSVTAPANGSSVSGTASVTANASDNVGVSKVEFYVNGALQATDTAAPYLYSWNTSALAAGTYTVMAKAYDAAGNLGQSSVSVSVLKDTTAPTATVSAPANGATVSGTATITASGTDNVGVSKIEIYENGVLKGVGNVSPFSYTWNTAAEANGTATLTAKAYDAAGNVGTSSSVSVTISNSATTTADTSAPTVAITAPTSGSTVSGTAAVTASASDNVGVSKVQFYVDGTLMSTDTATPFNYSWNTTTLANGTHTLVAKAYDAAGNVGTSSSMSVNVSNTATTTSAPISFVQVGSACPSSGSTVTVSYPKAQTAGNFNIIVIGRNDATQGVVSVTDTLGNTYTVTDGVIGTGLRQAIFYAPKIKGGTNQVKVTFTGSVAYPDVRVLEYSGLSAMDKVTSAAGSSSTASSGSVTTTCARELLFAANTVATGNSGAGSGFTARIITNPDSDLAEDKIVSSLGTYSATAPLLSSGPWVMQMVTFK